MIDSPATLILQLAAAISVSCSASVILTAALFPTMRKKLFMQIICYISLADMVGNALYIPPNRPPNGSFACSLEGFINLYAYPVSWLWTTVLMYFLYNLALQGKLPLSLPIFHGICWGIPFVFTLLNLTTNSYGRSDDYPEYEVCVLSGNYESGTIWHTITYDSLWLFCIVLMGYMYFRILCLRASDLAISVEQFTLATKTLGKYPIALFVFWFPHMLSVFLLRAILWKYNMVDYYVASLVVKILHGVATALIFFFDSSEARYLWHELFKQTIKQVFPAWCLCQNAADEDARSRESSVDPSRWGDKAFSLTYSVDDANRKNPNIPTFVFHPRFSTGDPEG